MAEFVVKLADERGHLSEQVERGFSASEVQERFAQLGFLVYSVKPRTMLSKGGGGFSLGGRKVKQTQFVVFNQQFLTLIKAGLPVMTALELLIKRQPAGFFRSLLDNVRERVKSGEVLSSAFDAQHAFPKVYTTTLQAGEKSGNMEEVLGRYIAYQRVAMTFRKKLAASLVYPTLLVTFVVVMLVFLVTYVVPEFAKLFENLNAKLPAITVFMLSLGLATQKYFVLIVIGLVGAVLGIWRWSKTDGGANLIDRAILRLPLLGGIWLKYQVANFSRMMSTLLQGGLPLVPALETAGPSMGSYRIRHGLEVAIEEVRGGQPLSKSLENRKVFPDLAVEMMEVGESTGALPAMLNSVAEFYEEDVQTAMTALMSLIEPMILIVMAVIVGGVLISLYLPIFTLGANFQH
jgi:type IV pilus assembly protein PilC